MNQVAISDQKAEEKIKDYNHVHFTLLGGPKSTQQLAAETSLGAEEVAHAIHYLSGQRLVESFWSEQASTKLHTVTEAGRMFAPPPPVPNFNLPACDPRKAKPVVKNTPRFSGTRHFDGINGKFNIDQNGHVILDPDKPRGKIYWSIIGEKTSADLARITGLPDTIIWSNCAELIRMGLLTFRTEGKARLYQHSTGMQAVAPSEDLEVIMPAKAPPKSDNLPADAKKVEVAAAPPDLGPAITLLLKTYSASDIALALFVEVDTELNELRDFKKLTNKMFSNVTQQEAK